MGTQNLVIWLELDHDHERYDKKFISPIFLVIAVVVVLLLQFESQYLKNCKWYKSETLHTGRV